MAAVLHMPDHLPPNKRSWNMSRIRSNHSKAEIVVRCLLHRAGFRFKVNDKSIAGCPDIVMRKYKTAVFVHGCFWHRHNNCPKAAVPSSNQDYWAEKFKRNVERDSIIRSTLEKQGWNVLVAWECEVLRNPHDTVNRIIYNLKGKQYKYNMSRNAILKIAEQRRTCLMGHENHAE